LLSLSLSLSPSESIKLAHQRALPPENRLLHTAAIFNRRGAVDSVNPIGLAINGWRKLTRFAISLSIWLFEIESEREIDFTTISDPSPRIR
jgi:hypothetical protein